MEIFSSCTLALLEVTFVFVGLLLLHSLRKIVLGNAAFYIAIGLLLVFTQLVSATELKVVLGYPGADFYIAQSVLFLPYLAIILIVYVTEGTLATQRLIIGAMVTLGFYIYLSHLTVIQCGWLGDSISQGPAKDSLEYLLKYSQRTMASSVLAQTLDLFLIPVFFQRLKNLQCRLFICVLGSLMLTQIVDTFVYVTACYWGDRLWWIHIKSSYIVKSIITIWLSIIAAIYLSRVEKEQAGGLNRGTLDIFLSFLGSYGRAQALQKNLQEWEGRYRVVVESSSDLIFLLNREGRILDVNGPVLRRLKLESKDSILNRSFPDMLADTELFPFDTEKLWSTLNIVDSDDIMQGKMSAGQNIELRMDAGSEGRIEMSAFVNSIMVENIPMLIVFGRDVSEQNRLQSEKEELREQLGHAQRLESVGKLAGGVAHDFNNYIHAIQGNIDILLYMHDIQDEKVVKHINRINEIADQAAKLTQQLLGFGRKGKYRIEKTDLVQIVEETIELFSPQSLKNIEVKVKLPRKQLSIKGDILQLKQVFLNILLNARDACEARGASEAEIAVSAGSASETPEQFAAATVGRQCGPPESYFFVRISDTGAGIEKSIINRIFDPFFTTKPVGKGTGMGLAMVYGAVSNHHGFLCVESELDRGTDFYVFLPENK